MTMKILHASHPFSPASTTATVDASADVAAQLAEIVHGHVVDLLTPRYGDGRTTDSPCDTTLQTLSRAAAERGVAALVVGHDGARELIDSRPGDGSGALGTLMSTCTAPLVIVPDVDDQTHPIRRVLIALDGDPRTSAALLPLVDAFRRAGRTVIAIHVLEPESAPPFHDHPGGFVDAFSEAFRSKHLHSEPATLTLRSGDPATRVVDVAEEVGADLVVLAWSQVLAAHRAAVVREVVSAGRTAVWLMPID